jgi:hypothetical protein
LVVRIFCYGNELKFTYEHLQFQKNFLGSLPLAIYGRRKERRGGEGKGEREGKGGRRKGGEGGRGVSPPNTKT